MKAKEFIIESFDKDQFVEMFSKFLPLAVKIIGLKSLPKIEFKEEITDGHQPTFGAYAEKGNSLSVAITNRHPNDIFRTLAHELVHYKQDTENKLDSIHSGETGSPIENEANAVAGVVMRHFNKQYPEYLSAKPIVFESAGDRGDISTGPGEQLIPFPKGTTMVDVSDVYDWYKLGMVISDLDDADPKMFGQGAPHTVIAFGSEEEEHKLLPLLKRLGLRVHDIDRPEDVKQAIPAKMLARDLAETIRKLGSRKFRLVSHTGKNLGTYSSRAGAEKRERQVQYFKHIGEDNDSTDYKQLDRILIELCRSLVSDNKKSNNGMVAAGVLDPKNRLVSAISARINGKWHHGEREAMDKYINKYGDIPDGSMIITTCSPCSENMPDRYAESCTDLINNSPIKKVYCGFTDYTQEEKKHNFELIETSNSDIRKICEKFAETFMKKESMAENFIQNENAVTFAGKDPNQFKSPKGGKPVMVIVTDQGSRYLITSDGMVLRHKSAHANTGGEDAGLQAWSDKIEFYDRSKPLVSGAMQNLAFPDAISYLFDKGRIELKTEYGSRVAKILDNGQWRTATIGDAMPTAVKSRPEWAKIEIKADDGTWGTQPKLGWQPLDYNQRPDGTLNRVHNGSPVSHGAPVQQSVAENFVNEQDVEEVVSGQYAKLYHSTPAMHLDSILQSGHLSPGNNGYLSLTRDPRLDYGSWDGSFVEFDIDQNAVRQRIKLEPFNDKSTMGGPRSQGGGESEERTKQKIPLKGFVTAMHAPTTWEGEKAGEYYGNLLKKYGVPIIYDIVPALEERKKRKKIRHAAYGPGPYGWYGYDANYSSGDGGAGGVAEGLLDKFIKPEMKFKIDDYDEELHVSVTLGGERVASAVFNVVGDDLKAQDLSVRPKYRGQGIAKKMYDMLKSKGYTIHRSQEQTDAGSHFWDKNKGRGSKVWEQGVAKTAEDWDNQDMEENFADGRNPQDKGDSARHGIRKGMTIAQLKKIRSSDSASPRKKQLAHWQINMRQGRKK